MNEVSRTAALLKLDLGCGTAKKAGFVGVDARQFQGVDVIADLRDRWPWDDNSVDEVHCSHFVEHLDAAERIHFVNELHRVLKHGCKALVIAPHWASRRAYGDLTHKWPPVSEFWFPYLSKEWRAQHAPHNDGYTCDFEVTGTYGVEESLTSKTQAEQEFALQNYKESAQDIIATFVKR